MKKTTFEVLAREFAACTLESRTLSNSHVDASHVTQIKIGVWPGTGFQWQMVGTFSVQIFRLGILGYLSRRSVYFGKFPFGQTKTVLPFTSRPKFQDFFGKWLTTNTNDNQSQQRCKKSRGLHRPVYPCKQTVQEQNSSAQKFAWTRVNGA